MYLRFFCFAKKIGYKALYTNKNRRFYDKHFGEALFKQGLQEIVNFEW